MPKNVYSEINLHMTWHTKNNDPVLIDSIKQRLHHYLEHEMRKTKNVFFHAVDGTENHVHLVATIPPSLLISEWNRKAKGRKLVLHQSRDCQSKVARLAGRLWRGEFRNLGSKMGC